MQDLDLLKNELEKAFNYYEFFFARRLAGRRLVAKSSKYSGADIWLRNGTIVIEPAIPEWKTRLVLGAGAVYLKATNQEYRIPAKKIAEYLMTTYKVDLRD
jgi:hypothetical protein